MNAHITANIPYATYPILNILGYVPKRDEDVEKLVADALAAETPGNNGDKDLDTPAFQVDRITGMVSLYRYSAWAEEDYQKERRSWYEEDPLEDLHWGSADVRSYHKIECPGGDTTISYLVQKATPR